MSKFPFALLLSFAASLPCRAGTLPTGAWTGYDRAAEAIYETLEIAGDTIVQGSPVNPNGGRCATTWREVFVGRGENYPGYQQAPVAGSRFEVLVLALRSDAVSAGGYAEFASLDEHWSQTGWHSFTSAPARATR